MHHNLLLSLLPVLIFTCLSSGAILSSTISKTSRRSTSQCEPFQSTFKNTDVSRSQQPSTPFNVVSSESSYNVADDGLELFLEKPNRPIRTKDGVNDLVAEGATVNSTFMIQYALF